MIERFSHFEETPKLLQRPAPQSGSVAPGRPVKLAARRETLEFWRDAVKLVRAMLAEHARYLAEARGAWLDAALRAVREGRGQLIVHHSEFILAHGRRLAEIFAAAEVAGRLRTRKQAEESADDADLAEASVKPASPAGRSAQPASLAGRSADFAEVFPADIPPTKVVEYIRSLPAVRSRSAGWEAFVARHQRQGFTVAGIESRRSLELLRNLVAESVEKGWSIARFEDTAVQLLDNLAKWGEGRLRTVWNMTVGNALREGRYAELREPEVARVLTHFWFDAIIDSVVRENHAALDNGIAPVDWPGWATYGDPLGFNCRCSRSSITRGRARKLLASGPPYQDLTESVPALAGPDPGFRRII